MPVLSSLAGNALLDPISAIRGAAICLRTNAFRRSSLLTQKGPPVPRHAAGAFSSNEYSGSAKE